jgi:hypothetical protein
MVRGRREPASQRGACRGTKIGTVLLDLRDAIRSAQQCRQTLTVLGVSRREWLEIVQDVDPEMRFLARPQALDGIVALLEKAGEPVSRETLIRKLLLQGAGSSRQIRYCIHVYLRIGVLTVHRGDKISLPEWDTEFQAC